MGDKVTEAAVVDRAVEVEVVAVEAVEEDLEENAFLTEDVITLVTMVIMGLLWHLCMLLTT